MSSLVRGLDVDNSCSPKPSDYDRFSAGLVASIVISGFVVLSLLMIWLGGGQHQTQAIPPLDPWPVIPPEDPAGLEHELDEIVGGSDSVELVSLLESIEDAVSPLSADDGSPGVGNSIPGNRLGRDDSLVPPGEILPSKRWKVSFEVDSLEQYKRQLDFLGIEIGVIDRREDEIWRIGQLATDIKITHSSRAEEQTSVWFAHRHPKLRRWDRQIATNSGLNAKDRIFVQFYPGELVALISRLEARKLEELGRNIEDVRTTNITISRLGDQFSVSVSDLEFAN